MKPSPLPGLAMAMMLVSCGAPEPDMASAPKEMEQGDWSPTPKITSVEPLSSGDILVRGVAAPGARVVLGATEGQAIAVAADAQGHFELQVDASAGGRLLTPENQLGQVTMPGPDQLLIVGGADPLAALLTQGGSSVRLTPGPVLDAVDGDGSGLIASGRAEPGRKIILRAQGAQSEVMADQDGRWTQDVPGVSDQPGIIQVDGRGFQYPGASPSSDRAERAGEGWRITRRLSASARQTTWWPDQGG